MEILFWCCSIIVVCIITGVLFYKPYLGIVFVIVCILFEGKINLDYISIYPLEVVMAIFIFTYISKLIVSKENYFRNTKLIYYYFPFMLCIFLSALKFIEFSPMVKEIVRWLELIVIYFLTINLITDQKKLKVILVTMLLCIAVVSSWGIVNCLAGNISKGERLGYVSVFNNPNALAGYIGLMMPVLLGVLMTSVIFWERVIVGVLSVLSTIIWFLAFSRSSWFSFVLTVSLIAFLTKVRKRVLFFLLIVLAIFTITFLSVNIGEGLIDRVKLSGIKNSLEERALCYPIGFSMVKDDLVLGIGIGNYPLLIEKFAKEVMLSTSLLIQGNLHSLYLQIFVETGILGLSAFVFWLVCIVKSLVGSLKALENTRNYSLFVGLLGGVIVYLLNNLTDVLVVHGMHLQWGIILGLAVVLTQFRESETCPETV